MEEAFKMVAIHSQTELRHIGKRLKIKGHTTYTKLNLAIDIVKKQKEIEKEKTRNIFDVSFE